MAYHNQPRHHRRSSFPHVQEAQAVAPSPLPSPTPTARAVVPEGTAWLERRQAGSIVVVSTQASDSGSGSGTKVPVGPIVGGIVAGIAIVLLAGGVWWWWVANKPKPAAPRPARQLPEVAPGKVPLPVSHARSRPSAPGTSSPASSSFAQQPQMNERGWTPPVVAGAGSSSRNHPSPPPAAKLKGARSVSGSDAPLLTSNPSSSSTSSGRRTSGGPPQLQTSPSKKSYNPSKPSPLSAGAAAASTAPKWGQMPFVSSGTSSQGHGGSNSREMDVLSTSPNSITPLNNKHLDVTRSPSQGMLSNSSHGSGGDRMSMVSEASRYSQAGPGGMSSDGHQVELGRQVSGEWGVAYDVEDENHRRSAPAYGYGAPPTGGHHAIGGTNDEAYGYEPEEVINNQQGGAGRESGYLDEELESYYRPRSGI